VTAGRFVTLEGIEGAGKTTVARALVAALQARGVRVTLTREPGGTPLAERVRTIALERGEETVPAEAETLLMFASRAIHLENLVRPALASGQWVICDRFTDATRAYQGGGRGVDRSLIETLARIVHRGLEPDLVLLLDLPVARGLARARRRNATGPATADDRFEAENLEFFERVRRAYLERAADPGARVRVIDADRDPDRVAADAVAALDELA
jgi:dTMP kinase